ncbi:hypothetical protein IT414_03350 [bacterium]|nr:hypothetical protein [bacterium]
MDIANHKPNVYLDIDGVLLANDKQPALHVHEFLDYVTSNYPTYWLTTHCKGDTEHTLWVLGQVLQAETLELCKRIRPTNWGRDKTDGIDFTKPFLWFDDDLFESERRVLEEHGVLDNHIRVDLGKNEHQLADYLASFPVPIENIT